MPYTPGVVWEAIFMLVILKIPVVYLCVVVWWAIRSEPRPYEGAALGPAAVEPEPRAPWSWWQRRVRRRPRRGGPHGAPARTYGRRAPALVRAALKR